MKSKSYFSSENKGITVRKGYLYCSLILVFIFGVSLNGFSQSFTYSQTNISCNGGSNGSITINATGGTTPYQYSIDGGSTFQSDSVFSNLAAGGYDVQVRDTIPNYSGITTVTLTQPDPLVASATGVNIDCYGNMSGQVNLSVSGGTGSYTYMWNYNGATTSSLSGLSPGTYVVTVTDGNNCTTTSDSVTLTQPAQIVIVTVASTNVTGCYGDSDGEINIEDVVGGDGFYNYSIDGGNTYSSDNDFTGLSAGIYQLEVIDFNGCTSLVINDTIIQPDSVIIDSIQIVNNYRCYGDDSGSIVVYVNGGSGFFNYSLNSGTFQIPNFYHLLTAGNYTMQVEDQYHCLSSISNFTITQPTEVTDVTSQTNVSCYNGNNGSITVTASGGTGIYTYSDNGGSSYQSSSTFNNLIAGNYSIDVMDSNGCVSPVTNVVTITQPNLLVATATGTNLTCFQNNSGIVSLTVTGGTSPYHYLWSNGATTSGISGLAIGSYSVTVTDFDNCVAISNSVTLTQPALLTVSVSGTNLTCYQNNTGSVSPTVNGGTTPYSYNWSNQATTSSISGLPIGTYAVTVTDVNGCTAYSNSVLLTQPTLLTASAGGFNLLCNGDGSGYVYVDVNGGTGNYYYNWSPGGYTTSDVGGLQIGTYTVVVTDDNGCTASSSVAITQPNVLVATASGTNLTCNSNNTGTVSVSTTGGTTPYGYAWNNNNNNQSQSGLDSGTYTVTVTDFDGCTSISSITITQPAVLTTSSITAHQYIGGYNVSCNGSCNGSITYSATGGTTLYSYSWVGPNSYTSASQNPTGLCAGSYNVTVSDANGCSTTSSITLSQPSTLTVNITGTNLTCYQNNSGTVSASINGGNATYHYLWSTGSTTTTISGLTAGSYSLTITDANNCTAVSNTVTLTQPALLATSSISAFQYNLNPNNYNVSCNGACNGSITYNPTGGTTPYTYNWSGPNSFTSISQNPSGLCAGAYNVTVSDVNHCSATSNITLTQPAAITFTTTHTNVDSCYGYSNGSILFSASGGTTPYAYSINNGSTYQAFTSFTHLTAGTYTVLVSDAYNCTSTPSTVVITQPTQVIFVSTHITNVLGCAGDATGSDSLLASGGASGFYEYSIDSGINGTYGQNAAFENLTAGTYYIRVEDTYGCLSLIQTITITQPDSVHNSVVVVNDSCFGNSNGRITVTGTGGTPGYTYSIDSGANYYSTNVFSGLPAGVYHIRVKDSHNCLSRVRTITVTQPAVLTTSSINVHQYNDGYNVTCFGSCNGSINYIAIGGTTPYNYIWTGPNSYTSTTQSPTSLCAGTYNVTVTDAKLCTTTNTITLTQPTQFTNSSISPQIYNDNYNITCFGSNTGNITYIATGGSTPYSYSWTGPNSYTSATQSPNSLYAGTYNVTATDANGCTTTNTITLSQPSALTTSSISAQVYNDNFNITCFGSNTGNITYSATGGSTPYSYSWTGPNSYTSASQSPTNLYAGTYNLTVTDNNGCTITNTITLSQPTALTTSGISAQVYNDNYNITCFGSNTGNITYSATGGSTPYSYSWTGPNSYTSASQSPSNLYAGTYNLTVTDNNGCTITNTITLIQSPAALTTSSISAQIYNDNYNITCFGSNTGNITYSATGGSTPYSYSWTGPNSYTSASQSPSNLYAGIYNLTVTDNNGCTTTNTITLIQPSVLSSNISSSTHAGGYNISCFGGSNGNITLTVNGGSTSYSFSWTGPNSYTSTAQSPTGLYAGTYNVTVTDYNGCTITNNITLTQPAALSASAFGFNLLCYDDGSGFVYVDVTGGAGNYYYLWSTGDVTSDVGGLQAGTYTVTVNDDNGCTASASVTITQPAVLVANATGTNLTCNSNNTGSITVTVTGGTTPYGYYWSNNVTNQSQSGLMAGTYTVTVTDFDNCSTTSVVTITQPAVLTTSGISAQIYNDNYNITCYGNNNGNITYSATGGTTPYSYIWTGPNSYTSASESPSNLYAGTYNLTVTDNNGCTTTNTITLSQPAALTTSSISAQVYNDNYNITCFGNNTGNITYSATGGSTPYSYSWTGPNSYTSASQSPSNLYAGTYNLTVTDNNGCTTTNTITLSQPTTLTTSSISALQYIGGYNVTCNGSCNGSITYSASGGSTPYIYSWSGPGNYSSTIQSPNGLCAGIYNLTVTDFNGCTTTNTITLTQPQPLTFTTSHINVSPCFANSNGSITVTSVSGGTPGYVYSNNSGPYQTSPLFSNLIAGTYTVAVKDTNNCVTMNSVVITQPALITFTDSISNVLCNNGQTGSITMFATGGQSGFYNYSINGGVTYRSNGTFDSLAAGTYTLHVQDDNNCQSNNSTVIVTQPTSVLLTITGANLTCFQNNTGSVNIVATGGSPDYDFLWNNGSTVSNPIGLSAGTFTVTVTDDNGCSATSTVAITQPVVLAAVASGTNLNCNGNPTGTLSVSVTGGTTSYSYLWSNGAITSTQTNVVAGTYTVTVTDHNGCTTTSSTVLSVPSSLLANATGTNLTCNGNHTGSVSVSVNGGTTPYSYNWNNGPTSPTQSNLAAGTYSVTVHDINGCSATATVTITQPTVLSASATGTNLACNNINTGAVMVTVAGGTTPYSYLWNNGPISSSQSNLASGSYTVTVTDGNVCTAISTVTITQPSAISASNNLVNVTCNGGGNGSITINASGGISPYTYSDNSGSSYQGLNVFSSLMAGNYGIIVKDFNNCTNTLNIVTITQPAIVAFTSIPVNITCNGAGNGSITITASGGNSVYQYSDNGGANYQLSNSFSNLGVGIYTIYVKDGNNCLSAPSLVTITQPNTLIITPSQVNVSCNGGSNGSSSVTVSGGTSSYQYTWSTGATISSISNLISGTYTVTVTDANNCTSSSVIVITQPGVFLVTANGTSLTCNGNNSGLVSATITGGTSPFTYLWSNTSTTLSISVLSAGTYTVTATDHNGCSSTSSATLTQPATVTFTSYVFNATTTCHNNGMIFVNAAGGDNYFHYSKDNGITYQVASVFDSLAGGTYTILLRDMNGCLSSSSVVVVGQPNPITFTTTFTNVSCNSGNNGTITVTATGGNSPYFYSSTGGAPYQSSNVLMGLTAGTYTVIVEDDSLCVSAPTSITLTQPTALTLYLSAATHVDAYNISCNGGSNGSITLTRGGGITPYSYSWTGPNSYSSSVQSPGSLFAGTYNVTVTDANGCTITNSITLTQPVALTTSSISAFQYADGYNITCNGLSNGSITYIATGGSTNYSYSWTGPNSYTSTVQSPTSLVAGMYNITVTDANFCTTTNSIILTQAAPLTTSGISAHAYNGGYNITCNGASNGSIIYSATGGSTNYNYNWTGPNSYTSSVQSPSGLFAGTYNVTVTDANGCTTTNNIILTQPNIISITNITAHQFIDGYNVSCFGSSNGSISGITVIGGDVNHYAYLWSNGSTAANPTGLSAITYFVTVTDDNNCSTTSSITLTQPSQVAITSITPHQYNLGYNITCHGASNGSFSVAASGGSTGYTYSKDGGNTYQNSNLFSGLTAGTYTVFVKDSNNCTTSTNIILTQPATLTSSVTDTSYNDGYNVTCNGSSNGKIFLTVNGGSTTYSYLWTNNSTLQNISGLTAGQYSVTVTDFNGCTTTSTITLTQPQILTTLSISDTIYADGYNIKCYGDNNGKIFFQATGGSTTYAYSWTGPNNYSSTVQSPNALYAGTYNVTITDANTCSTTNNITLTQPTQLNTPLLTPIVYQQGYNVTCYGINNGGITLSESGGSTPYVYNWTGSTYDSLNNYSSTVQSPGSLKANYTDSFPSAKNYVVIVTDANGCTNTNNIQLSQPQPIDIIGAAITNVLGCYGDHTGEVVITAIHGNGYYIYSDNYGVSFQPPQAFFSLGAGNYGLQVKDNYGCLSAIDTITITQPPQIVYTATSTLVSCNSGNDGTITVSASGGTGTLIYSNDGGLSYQFSNFFDSLTAGTYTMVVQDSNNCTITHSVIVNQIPTLTTSLIAATYNGGYNINCNGNSDGSITLTVSGGTTSYSYLWSNTSTNANQSGLSAGTYTVTVTDAHGCISISTITLTQPDQLMSSATGYDLLCNNDNSGEVVLSVSGGDGNYFFNWNNGEYSTQDLFGVSAGSYSVVVNDDNGCSTGTSVILTQPATLVATTSGTNLTCNGNSSGSVRVTVNGGTPDYSYSWSNGATDATSNSIAAGTYTVTVTDNNGCTTVDNVVITQPNVIIPNDAGTLVFSLLCNGDGSGAILLTTTGGTPSYTYMWSGPNSYSATDQEIFGLYAGNYYVTATDVNNCIGTATVIVTQPNPLVVSASGTNLTCNNNNTGTITATQTGGTSPYTYLWSNNSVSENQSGLAIGTYTVTVTDADGCTNSSSVTITQPDVLTSSVSSGTYIGGFNVSCNGASNGSITLTVTGGTTTYSYSWNGPNNYSSTIQNPSELASGNYSVTVTDVNGCSSVSSITLYQPAILGSSISAATQLGGYNISCNGGSNGSITLSVNGGNTNYSYSWTGPNNYLSTDQNPTGLMAGSYNVTVTDANGCTATNSINLSQPNSLIAIASGFNLLCNGDGTGSVSVSVTGGAGNYYYNWNTGASTSSVNGLQIGTYDVTVTDDNGCTSSSLITLTQPTVLTSSITPVTHTGGYNISCNGGSNGSITASGNGGTSGYSYSWNNNNTVASQGGLSIGTYTVTVTDQNSCTSVSTITLTQPTTLTASTSSPTYNGGYNVSCFGCNDGSINLITNGGTPSYTYSWSGPNSFTSSNQNPSGLLAGTYNVTVTDANGCTSVSTITLTQPSSLSASAYAATYIGGYNVSCNGASNGSITLTVTGGTPLYTYSWSGPNSFTSSVQNPNGLAAGTYYVTVTDANSNNTTTNITLIQPATLTTLSITANQYIGGYNVSCNGACNGSITYIATGGNTTYSYSWTGPNGYTSAAQSPSGICAGTYNVTVTDANGCSTTNSITLTQPAVLTTANISAHQYFGGYNVTCNGASNGSIIYSATGGNTGYSYNWTGPNNFTSNVQSPSGLFAGIYNVTVTDANGCSTTSNITLTQANVLVASSSGTNLTCNGNNTGTVTASQTGGTAPYGYFWNGGATTISQTGLAIGTYTVTVTDANGCTSSSSVNITQPVTLTSSISSPTHIGGYNISCNGGNDGTITLTPAGGTTAYHYNWTGPNSYTSTVQNPIGLVAGTYFVTVTDANGCSTTNSIILSQPNAVTFTTSQVNVTTCYSYNNGSLTVTSIAGGNSGYTYSNNGGSSFQTSPTFNNLTGGAYTVVVKDTNGCTGSNIITITTTVPVTFTTTITSVTCNGYSTGGITINATGGTPNYTYSIDNGSSYHPGSGFTGLQAGIYPVIVKDNLGCVSAVVNTAVTQPNAITYTTSQSNLLCNNDNSGSITVAATGGTTPYSYSDDNFNTSQSSPTLSGLSAGPYTIYVTDANGCPSTNANVTLTQPAAVTFTTTVVNVLCHGGTSGSITVSASGGTGPYMYSSNGGNSYQSSNSLTGLSATGYSVIVKDVNNCVSNSTVITLTQPATLSVGISFQQNVVCNGAATGELILSHSGGVSAYSYSDNGGSSFQLGTTFNTLTAGTYHVEVQDHNGCTATNTAIITQNSAISLAGTTFTNVNCNGTNSGSITVHASGGAGSFQYSDNGGNSYQGSAFFGTLDTGTYPVVVQDGNGCTATMAITITQPAAITFTTTQTNVGCTGGSITVNATGGIQPYMYSSDNGNTYQSGNVFSNLNAGTYSIIVSDNAQPTCYSGEADVVITTIAPITFTSTHTNVSCNGGSNGTITVTASGGVSPYTYSSDGGATYHSSLTGLGSGTYSVVVKDANGCTSSPSNVTITQPSAITFSASPTSPSCNGGSNGSISVSASGGSGALSYSDNNGSSYQGGSSFSNLAAGTYTVLVTDAHSCTTTPSVVTVTQPTAISVSNSTTDATACIGGSDVITASGGTGTLTYSDNGGSTYQGSNTFSGLAAGNYTIVVKDAHGCTSSSSITINGPVTLSFSTTQTNVTCNGGSNGSISVSASGGVTPYSYSDNGGSSYQGGSSFSSLTQGTYTVVVKDANGCTTSSNVTIAQPAAVTFTTSSTNVSCNGAGNGTITVSATGGTNPLSYSDGNGFGNSNSFTGLAPNTYVISVQDVNGCTSTPANVTISQPAVLAYTATPVNATCNGQNGSISFSVTGGTAPYSYSSDNGSTYYNTLPGLPAGTYAVVVKDVNGCSQSSSVTITQPTAITMVNNQGSNGCAGGVDTIIASGGIPGYTYSDNGGSTYQGSNIFSGLAVGNYTIVVKDNNGCTSSSTISVTSASPVSITNTPTGVACNGGSTGSDVINVSGGTGPYTYSEDGGITYPSGSNTFNNLTAGTYTMAVKDVNGCTAAASVIITQNSAITMTNYQTNVTCNGGSDGKDSVVASGGTSPYTYSDGGINGFGVSNVFTGLSSAAYTITVKDNNVCTVSATVTITQPTPLNPIITDNPNSNVCPSTFGNQHDTLLSSSFSAYHWSSGATTQSIVVSAAGTYTLTVTGSGGCTATVATVITKVCGTPTGETVCCIGANHSATISWNGVPCAATYTVEYRQQYSPDTGTWHTFAVQSTSTSHTFTGNNVLHANTTYEWAVRSNCDNSSSVTSAFSSVNTFTTTGPRGAVVVNEFSVYPNPASEAVTVRFSSETENSPYIIRMYDLTGRMVMINNGETNEGDNQVELNISNIAKGIYIVSLEENGTINKLKLVVQ